MRESELIILRQKVEDIELRLDVYHKMLEMLDGSQGFGDLIKKAKAAVFTERAHRMLEKMGRPI